jgi:hypothetical protein
MVKGGGCYVRVCFVMVKVLWWWECCGVNVTLFFN